MSCVLLTNGSKLVKQQKEKKKEDNKCSQDRDCLVLHVRVAQLPHVGGKEGTGVPVEDIGHTPTYSPKTKMESLNVDALK